MKKKIAVIGGGFSGLAVAEHLSGRKDFAVTIFEKERRLGGAAAGFKKRGWDWYLDYFYHHIFTDDKSLLNWLSDLDLSNRIDFFAAKTGVLHEGGIYPFSSAGDVLRFERLGLFSRLRLGAGVMALKTSPWLPWMDRVTAAAWLPRLVGRPAFEEIWKPLLISKFGRDYWDQISLSWFWARVKKRSLRLGYPRGGFSLLADEIGSKLRTRGVEIKLARHLTRLDQVSKRWRLGFKAGRPRIFDQVVLTIPFPYSLRVINKFLSPRDKKRFASIETMGTISLVLRLQNKFLKDGTYWLNILNVASPFVAVVEQTNLVSSKAYNGQHLVYVGGYYSLTDPIFHKTKQGMFRLFAPWLRKINLDFEKDLIGFDCFKSLFAQPVMRVGYQKQKPGFAVGPPGLYWTSLHHIYPWDRGVNFAVEYGQRLGKILTGISLS